MLIKQWAANVALPQVSKWQPCAVAQQNVPIESVKVTEHCGIVYQPEGKMLLRKACSPIHTHNRVQHVSFQEELYRKQLPSCRKQVK